MRLCIANGWVLNPANNKQEAANVWIEDGLVVKWSTEEPDASWEVLDASGKWVVPGLIDLHVHFRDPGQTYKEDIESGSAAAARGGFTTVCCMPNTKPALDSLETVRYVEERAEQACGINVLPVAAITKGQECVELVDIEGLAAADTRCRVLTHSRGICALSEDGKSVMDSASMREAMERAQKAGVPIFAHTEDAALAGGAMNEGEASRELGVSGVPAEAEEIIAIRDILLSKATGCQLHLCHISTKGSLDLIRLGKAWGLPITAETAPHYFTLTDRDVADANRKMNPPLRTKEDVEAIKAALADGTLDVIATDHAPHSAEEKGRDLEKAPFGVVGLETSFAVSYTSLVKPGVLTPMQLIDRMSAAPARILGIDRGDISPGKPADLAVIDIDREYEIDPEQFLSKGRNTPFAGRKVAGKVVCTLAEGRIVYQEQE